MALNDKKEMAHVTDNSDESKRKGLTELIKICTDNALRITQKIKCRKHDRKYADDWKVDLT